MIYIMIKLQFLAVLILILCRKTPQEIYERSCKMLEKTQDKGGYALGSGNSIPYYVPFENYLAMISAVTVNS